ncbi:hypothetical protein SISSUDRAFT_1116585 [Sistotremastrum suecicum HHB10207 ss-3]|uniref:RNA-dependent RNA polymerase n=1 Tax=Sistotremastrum suecicum HHB10207 ss-3 TaxID=1314776 RepID=A0A166HYY3_9AGAM|nr:hypothetical protein SISSUDRAFT_1116585 [Sistotremastrum suecicum HHB10207 ss-3]
MEDDPMNGNSYDSDDTEIEILPGDPRLVGAPPGRVSGAPHEPYAVVAFDPATQNLLNRFNVPWGVIWEISRLITNKKISWHHITPGILSKLGKLNSEAVPMLFDLLKLPREGDPLVWAELDLEHAAMVEGACRGLGCYEGPCILPDGTPVEFPAGWFGGKIEQTATLIPNPASPDKFSLVLDKMALGRSFQCSRRLGSRRIIRIRKSKMADILRDTDATRFLQRHGFVICGRVFRLVFPKDGGAYLAEFEEDYGRAGTHEDHLHRLTFSTFISLFNNPIYNSSQSLSKWASRFQLIFSTSHPVLTFAKENIHFFDDIVAPGHENVRKPPAEMIMTDGCGYMNSTALRMIANVMKLEVRPVAVQGRIYGSKGIWMLHPDHQTDNEGQPPTIWIRHSQRKIKFSANPNPLYAKVDPSHYVFNMLRYNTLTSPSRLSMQTINNMAENGVPHQVFVNLMSEGVNALVEPLTDWNSRNAMANLLTTVSNQGRVLSARAIRLAGASSRAFGFSRLERTDSMDSTADSVASTNSSPIDEFGPGIDIVIDEDDRYRNQSEVERIPAHLIDAIRRNPISGLPREPSEAILGMVEAGFHPQKSDFLYDQLRIFMKWVVETYVKEYHLPVKESAEAFIVPDPFGILDPGEIYFYSSHGYVDGLQLKTHIIKGPVLVGRNPTRVGSDIRKFTAIDRKDGYPTFLQQYTEYKDVIILSVKGPRSPASYLSGGDYDGDTAYIHWRRDLVDPFHDAPLLVPPSGFLGLNFESTIERVSDWLDRTAVLNPTQRMHMTTEAIGLSFRDRTVGQYSQMHDGAVYAFGYNHRETVRLAFMFNTCLDGIKTGLRVKKEVYETDKRMYLRPLPPCMAKASREPRGETGGSNTVHRNRHPSLKGFVLDRLMEAGTALQNAALKRYEDIPKVRQFCDPDFTAVHEEAHDAVLRLVKYQPLENPKYLELKEFRKIVNDTLDEYKDLTALMARRAKGKNKMLSAERYAKIEEITRRFHNPEQTARYHTKDEVKRFMAATAYTYCVHRGGVSPISQEYAFHMAYTTLLLIKAEANHHIYQTVTAGNTPFLAVDQRAVNAANSSTAW